MSGADGLPLLPAAAAALSGGASCKEEEEEEEEEEAAAASASPYIECKKRGGRGRAQQGIFGVYACLTFNNVCHLEKQLPFWERNKI